MIRAVGCSGQINKKGKHNKWVPVQNFLNVMASLYKVVITFVSPPPKSWRRICTPDSHSHGGGEKTNSNRRLVVADAEAAITWIQTDTRHQTGHHVSGWWKRPAENTCGAHSRLPNRTSDAYFHYYYDITWATDLHACLAAPSSSSYTVQRVVCHRSITTSIPTSVKWSAFRKLRLFTVVFCRLLLLSKFLLFDAAQNESLCNNFWWLNSSSADHLLPVHHIAFYSCSAAVGRYLSDQWCWWCLHHGGGVSAARGFSYLNNN